MSAPNSNYMKWQTVESDRGEAIAYFRMLEMLKSTNYKIKGYEPDFRSGLEASINALGPVQRYQAQNRHASSHHAPQPAYSAPRTTRNIAYSLPAYKAKGYR